MNETSGAVRYLSVCVCACVRACLTIIFGQKLTSERKHAEFIIMIVHTETTCRSFSGLPKMPQKVSGVSAENVNCGAAEEQQCASSCVTFLISFLFSLSFELNANTAVYHKPYIKSTNKPLHTITYSKRSSVWGFPSSQYVNHAA